MEEELRAFVAFGLTLLLVMLRAEAERFGVAEYDEPVGGHQPSLVRRLAWYALALGGVVAILFVHPAPGRDFFFTGGGGDGVLLGFLLAALGAGIAVGIAWRRYRHVRLPDVAQYPGALINEVATAFFDEAVFRVKDIRAETAVFIFFGADFPRCDEVDGCMKFKKPDVSMAFGAF